MIVLSLDEQVCVRLQSTCDDRSPLSTETCMCVFLCTRLGDAEANRSHISISEGTIKYKTAQHTRSIKDALQMQSTGPNTGMLCIFDSALYSTID